MGLKLTYDFITPSERAHFQLSEKHKMIEICSSKLKLWLFEETCFTVRTQTFVCTVTCDIVSQARIVFVRIVSTLRTMATGLRLLRTWAFSTESSPHSVYTTASWVTELLNYYPCVNFAPQYYIFLLIILLLLKNVYRRSWLISAYRTVGQKSF